MKRIILITVVIAQILISITSCSKKLTPSLVQGKAGKGFDADAFNYVYVEAIKQKLMGNGADALKYLEQCIKINPGSDAAYYQIAQIVIGNGDLDNGKKYALKALSIDEGNLWYLMMLAGMYYQEKDLDSAIIYYEKAIKNYPENDNLRLTLGTLYSENSNFEKAGMMFESLDNKYGVNETSTVSAVRSLMAAGNYDAALLKTRLLLDKYPDELLYNGLLAEIYRGTGEKEKALGVYERLIKKDPDNPQTQLSLCDFLITEKSYDDLFLYLNTLILNTQILKEDKISLIARVIGLEDLNQEKQEKLMINILVLEASYKEDNIVPLLRPELLIKQGKFVETAARLEELIKSDPQNYYAWEKLLMVYLQLGDFNMLMKRGEECATKFNRSFVAKILYANGAVESGKYIIALEELKKAEILAGDNRDYLNQVLTMRADVYYRTKDYANAFVVFDEALKLNKDDLTVLNNYAYYLAEQNMRLKEAEDMARKVIETEKGNTTFLDTYAWVLYKRGKLNEAAAIMESVIKSGEKADAEWFEHYGYILKKQKKCEKAVENWNMALKLDLRKTHLVKEIQDCKR